MSVTKVHFDPIPSGPLGNAVQIVKGWILGAAGAVEFLVSDAPISDVRWIDRPDAQAVFPGEPVTGFEFFLDIRNLQRRTQGASMVVAVGPGGTRLGKLRLRIAAPTNLRLDERLVTYFMHIPKTAGTSVRRIIEDKSEYFNPLFIYDEGGYVRRQTYMALSHAAISEFDLVYGHFQYGLHGAHIGPHRYITILRDSADYYVSLYFFSKYQMRDADFANYKSIYDYLENTSPPHDNPMCRLLGGLYFHDKLIDDSNFREIMNIVERDYAYIGLSERLSESLSAISDIIGVDICSDVNHENKTTPTDEFLNLNLIDFRKFARPYTRYDAILRQYVEDRYFGINHTVDDRTLPAGRTSSGGAADGVAARPSIANKIPAPPID